MDREKIEDVLAFALCIAGENDGEWDARSLGPIHLLKYMYLADVLHARRTGDGLTGIDWTFYNFGPWSAPAHELIDPIMRSLGASVNYDRYRLANPERCEHARKRLPSAVWLGLRRAVQEFGGSTESLLEHVYMTAPMRHARPGGRIDLTQDDTDVVAGVVEPAPALSTRQARQVAERLAEGRRLVAALAREKALKRAAMVQVVPPEDALRALEDGGQEWIDSLAGEPVPEVVDGLVIFDDAIWDTPRDKPLP